MPEPHLRAADSDRAAVATALGRAMAEGRLTVAEYDERLASVYAARTYGALAGLTADLPRATAPPVPRPSAPPAARHERRAGAERHSRADWWARVELNPHVLPATRTCTVRVCHAATVPGEGRH